MTLRYTQCRWSEEMSLAPSSEFVFEDYTGGSPQPPDTIPGSAIPSVLRETSDMMTAKIKPESKLSHIQAKCLPSCTVSPTWNSACPPHLYSHLYSGSLSLVNHSSIFSFSSSSIPALNIWKMQILGYREFYGKQEGYLQQQLTPVSTDLEERVGSCPKYPGLFLTLCSGVTTRNGSGNYKWFWGLNQKALYYFSVPLGNFY